MYGYIINDDAVCFDCPIVNDSTYKHMLKNYTFNGEFGIKMKHKKKLTEKNANRKEKTRRFRTHYKYEGS